jgi:hypothetical protein
LIVGSLVYNAVAAPFRGDTGAATYAQHVNFAVTRKAGPFTNQDHQADLRIDVVAAEYVAASVCRAAQSFKYADRTRWVGGSFSSVYEKYCKQINVEPQFVTLKSGVKAFWLGDPKTAKYVCCYFHGMDAPSLVLTFT